MPIRNCDKQSKTLILPFSVVRNLPERSDYVTICLSKRVPLILCHLDCPCSRATLNAAAAIYRGDLITRHIQSSTSSTRTPNPVRAACARGSDEYHVS